MQATRKVGLPAGVRCSTLLPGGVTNFSRKRPVGVALQKSLASGLRLLFAPQLHKREDRYAIPLLGERTASKFAAAGLGECERFLGIFCQFRAGAVEFANFSKVAVVVGFIARSTAFAHRFVGSSPAVLRCFGRWRMISSFVWELRGWWGEHRLRSRNNCRPILLNRLRRRRGGNPFLNGGGCSGRQWGRAGVVPEQRDSQADGGDNSDNPPTAGGRRRAASRGGGTKLLLQACEPGLDPIPGGMACRDM